MVSTEGRFLQWLRDAHAMEEQAEQMLSGTASRIKNYPELKAQLERHLDETRRQADMVRRCIERHGTSTSTVKDTAAKLVAIGQVLSGLFVGDEIVKASLGTYTFEHMEIGSYRILIATAEALGDTETKLFPQLPPAEAHVGAARPTHERLQQTEPIRAACVCRLADEWAAGSWRAGQKSIGVAHNSA